jgi:dihydrofolate reductase
VADLIYTTNVSLDGFIEDERGSFDFSQPTDEYFAFVTDLERPAGAYLYGRRQYEAMSVWETDASLAAQSDLYADFAAMWQAADKVVVSTTLETVTTARTRVERRFDPEAVGALKASTEGHVTIGGAELAGQALGAGLVDEVRLFVSPVILGGGKPAVPRGIRVGLELVDERRVDGTTVYLRYRCTR